MPGKFSFQLRSEERRRAFPHKLVIGQRDSETRGRVLLRLIGYLLFFRDRLQIEPRLDLDLIPFEPDLLQCDYELRPVLWVECGGADVARLDRLAVKVPEAEIWVLKPSVAEAEEQVRQMAKAGLRRNRYRVIGLEGDAFAELEGLLMARNEVYWVGGGFDPPEMRFEFNGLWFELAFRILAL
jgi:uncharacterized protein YaeQ